MVAGLECRRESSDPLREEKADPSTARLALTKSERKKEPAAAVGMTTRANGEVASK